MLDGTCGKVGADIKLDKFIRELEQTNDALENAKREFWGGRERRGCCWRAFVKNVEQISN